MGLVAPTSAHDFGKYTLVAKLAVGGMAEIFLARLKGAAGFEKLVVIKRILPHLAKDQQLVSMFLAEAKIAAQISHPNVCSVYELGELEHRYFIAMEYLEGVPFACFRRNDLYPTSIDPRLVVGLGIQACEGLHHAHQLRRADGSPLEVVHRDVSSSNLFATTDGMVKVLDFGIAKIQDTSVRTSTGSVKGTYAYMAPEQLRGERLDRRTDLFALGTVLWELFAQRHLFKKETDFLTFQAISTDPIPEVAELRPDVPPALNDVIAKALSRDRDERFPTARAMGEALTKAVAAIGGPMSPGEISDEIARAFEPRLGDQRTLIRIAREGMALPLDEDYGPAVVHGTAMVTTPVSVISNRPAEATTVDPAPAARAPSSRGPVDERPATLPPAAPTHLRQWIVILSIVAVTAIAAAIVFAMRAGKDADTPSGGDGSGRVVATAPVDAAAAPDAAIVAEAADAGIAEPAPADAAVAATEPPADAAPVEPPADARVVKRPPPPPRPTGPPGFITIDSAPVYATIYIDGKRIGDTPLIKVSLPPGKHSVRAVSPSGTTKNFSIQITSGKTAQPRRIQW